ncbi:MULTISPECIES: T9SS type A sorting domain-containing protein [Bacteroidales]|uniref:T9SS type A sorting domain-containing protein n=1 Tax=Bacteroidales TaxID=171549 RepID=UPI0012B56CA3|nr:MULTISPECIES: T9SS type A sorting domain-containing protein [Bacteroidales]
MRTKLITLVLAGMTFIATDSFARKVYVKLGTDTQAWSNVVEDNDNVVITLPSGSSDFVLNVIDQLQEGDEVWVAKGVYENSATMILNADNNRTDVTLYGGFIGTETSIEQRVKSDVDGNGIVEPWEFTNVTNFKGKGSADDASSTFVMLSMQSGTTVDGVTISDNYYTGQTASGGSIGGSGTVRNTIFRNLVTENKTDGKNITGGGIYISGGHVDGCLIESCAAIQTANNGGQNQGGGVLIYGVSDNNCGIRTPSGYLKNSIIRNCKSEGGSKPMGAAIFYKNGAIVENCVIANNASTRGANGTKDGQGVIQGHTKGDATYEVNRFINCTIVNNVADIYTIFFEAACTEVYNCICWGNTTGGKDYPTQDSDYNNNIRWAAESNVKSGTYPYVESFAYNSAGIYNIASVQNTYSPILLSFPLVEGTSETEGENPEFVNPTIYPGLAITDEDMDNIRKANWSLKEGSPLINAGVNTPNNMGEFVANATLPASLPEMDLLGKVRVGNFDLGAYEFGAVSGIRKSTIDTTCRIFSNEGALQILGLNDVAIVQIYALDGALVYNATIDTENVVLPMSLKGCYVVKVQDVNGVYGQKVIF